MNAGKISPFFALCFTLLLATGCTSPQDLLEKGDYDRAVSLALKKLAGKKKKAKYVVALEEAFEKANQRDLYWAERLKKENRAENWADIHEIYAKIRRRQDAIRPLLPLIDDDGIQAKFQFVRIDDLELEAKKKAADYHYSEAQRLLDQAKRGDRLAARNAYEELDQLNRYYQNYKDQAVLEQQALDLGNTRILLKLENNAGVVLPYALEDELLRFPIQGLNSRWQTYLTRSEPKSPPHYQVVINFTNIVVSPERVKERAFEESREVQDGFEYVLDNNGNVLKDSLGNDVKVPRKIWVRAQVLETLQSKEASVAGYIELYDMTNNNLLERKPLRADALFENYASTFRGDRRALSTSSKQRIGNRPVPFPSSESLLIQAADELKPVIKSILTNNRKLI